MDIVSKPIEEYATAHSNPLPPLLDRVAARTRAETSAPQMMVGRLEGNVLAMLIRLSGARRVVEVGTFTGYSALCMASALPEDGEIVTCELNDAHADIAQSFFDESEHKHRIHLRRGPAIATLRDLPDTSFDMVFIDADKEGYPEYWEQAMRILRTGGFVVADNVLWSGRVLDPQDDATRAIVAFNEKVARDARVDRVMLTVRDGMTIARKR
ncbi:MAG TPA: O-methyltransferase [Vulgatibacter sp.]|nr:O-methyltransferase [Vulgatibacter sp.]